MAVSAEDIETDDIAIIFDEDELADWLYDHEYTGGTVYLGCDIILTYQLAPYTDETAPIIIDAREFSLIFDGGCLVNSNGFLMITGEGIIAPVVDVYDVGWMWMGNWNSVLRELNITATGKDGLGGTALRINSVDGGSVTNITLMIDEGIIRSYGVNAVGLEFCVPADAYCFRVEVEGENSVAVSAPDETTLYYCKLIAYGDGATVVSGGDILLDACAVSPVPSDATIITRRIADISLNRFYLPIKQNSMLDWFYLSMQSSPVFFLSGGGEFTEKPQFLYVNWDFYAYEQIDTGVLGKTNVSGIFDPAFQGLGFTDILELTLTVEVRDPALPCIERVDFYEDEQGKYAVFYLWESYDPHEDGVIFWRSDNGGDNWTDITYFESVKWSGSIFGGEIKFYYDETEIENPIQFQLELPDIGESNIVILQIKDGGVYYGPGGDRTGTDRGGAKTPDSDDNQSDNNMNKSDDSDLKDNDNIPDNAAKPDDEKNPGNNKPPDNKSNPDNKNDKNSTSRQRQQKEDNELDSDNSESAEQLKQLNINEDSDVKYIENLPNNDYSPESNTFDNKNQPADVQSELTHIDIIEIIEIIENERDPIKLTVQENRDIPAQPVQEEIILKIVSLNENEPETKINAGIITENNELKLTQTEDSTNLMVLAETVPDIAEPPVIEAFNSVPEPTLKETQPVPESEQSASMPSFDMNIAIIISLCIAAALSGALIWLKVRRARR